MSIRQLFVMIFLFPAGAAKAEVSARTQPFSGISYYAETRTSPPQLLFVAEVDLQNPKVHLKVAPGGPDPDGDGKWETTLMPPTEIAAREHFDLVINGDFFDANQVKDAEGAAARYRPGQWASVIGTAVTDGKAWATSQVARPCLVVHRDGHVTIEPLTTPPMDGQEVIGGNVMLVQDGKNVAPANNKALHPRTVVGLDAGGRKLTILVVDGRLPGIAIGMSYADLAREMIRLGCTQALNLDGGGSSLLAVRNAATGRMKIVNLPTDGRERAVAEVLGVNVDR